MYRSPLTRLSSRHPRYARLLGLWQRQPLLLAVAMLLIVSGVLAGLFNNNEPESSSQLATELLTDGSYLRNPPATALDPQLTVPAPSTGNEQPTDNEQPTGASSRPGESVTDLVSDGLDATAAQLDDPERVATQPLAEQARWQPIQVNSGDTMEKIFRNLSLSPSLLYQIVTHDDKTRSLADLRSGELLDFAWHDDGSLAALKRAYDDDAWLVIERDGNGDINSHLQSRDLQTRVVETAEIINHNLFIAGQRAGMSDPLIMRMAGIFAWDIDFALDIRRGDQFSLIYEEIWRDGSFLRDGEIIAASFTNQGQKFTALRFEVDGQVAYYSPEGRPMRKAFLRAPLNFTRVTSNFNPRRYHPVLKRVRAHNGTDYGAPSGTPVYAAGAGTVIASAYNNANGNYVFIRHRNQVVTKYLHFSKRLVKNGERVRQGQTIGLVGSTGLASGPHLHYEFLVNGAHRNPRTVDLPEDPPLSKAMVAKLQQQHGHLVQQLARIDSDMQARQLAAANANNTSSDLSAEKALAGPGPR